MKRLCCFFILMLPLFASAEKDKLCPHVDSFLKSVNSDQGESIELHTSWGSNFTDDSETALSAKRCIHRNQAAAKDLCNYLMKNTSTEFPGVNFKHILMCLSPDSKLPSSLNINSASISLDYGTEQRSIDVNLTLREDDKLGGWVLILESQGY